MAALTLDALLRGLKKGAPDPVYLLHGDEDVLKDEAVRALLDATVDPAARDFNLDSRFAADLDAEPFNALVNTPPMLAARRAVVLRGVRHGETVHDLVEAALERRAARAAQLVEPVLEQAGTCGVKIVTLLGTHLVGTALARAELEGGSGRLEDVVFRHLLASRPYGLRG